MSHLSLIELLCAHWLCNAIYMSHLMLRLIFSFLKFDFKLAPCMDRFKQIDCSGFVFFNMICHNPCWKHFDFSEISCCIASLHLEFEKLKACIWEDLE